MEAEALFVFCEWCALADADNDGNQFRMKGATTGSGHSQSQHEATKDGDVEPSGATPSSANASYTFIGNQWQFNMATTNLDVGTYTYHINLIYGTYISFTVRMK